MLLPSFSCNGREDSTPVALWLGHVWRGQWEQLRQSLDPTHNHRWQIRQSPSLADAPSRPPSKYEGDSGPESTPGTADRVFRRSECMHQKSFSHRTLDWSYHPTSYLGCPQDGQTLPHPRRTDNSSYSGGGRTRVPCRHKPGNPSSHYGYLQPQY